MATNTTKEKRDRVPRRHLFAADGTFVVNYKGAVHAEFSTPADATTAANLLNKTLRRQFSAAAPGLSFYIANIGSANEPDWQVIYHNGNPMPASHIEVALWLAFNPDAKNGKTLSTKSNKKNPATEPM